MRKRQEAAPAGKSAMAIATKMASKAQPIKLVKANGGKSKGRVRVAVDSSEDSDGDELIGSDHSSVSEAELEMEPPVSQIIKKRKKQNSAPLAEVPSSILIFVHSHVMIPF